MKTSRPNQKVFFFLFSALFFFSAKTFAQEKFQLSDYVNPEYRWQKLDINFGLGGHNSFNKQDIDNGTGSQQSASNFSSNLSGNYYGTKNSSSYQGYQDIGISGSVGSSKYDNENPSDANPINNTKNKSGSVSMYAETINRFYNKKKMFLETDLDLGIGYSSSSTDYTSDQEVLLAVYQSDHFSYDINASLPLMIGIGRIEEVQDARLAVYILDDLTTAGDLKRAATNEEILLFSEFITNTKNQRFFDARIRKIAEITAIDSFLTAKGLKAESDASYYTLIYDNWEYANGPVRSQGSRFSVGVVPGISLSRDEGETFWRDTLNSPDIIKSFSSLYSTETDAWGLDFVTGYTWEKPVKLCWQHTIDARLAYSLYHEDFNNNYYIRDSLTSEFKNRTDSPNAKIALGYSIGYYPNSRTEITLGVMTAYNQFWGNQVTNDETEIDLGRIILDNSIHLSCYYYISPQLRFYMDINSMYSYTKRNQEQPDDETGDEFVHDFQNYISAGLTYSIF